MSRLDSFIARMQAQRDCLNFLKPAIDALRGPILEVGLGNGRTYDHLRDLFPGRDIYVFERKVAAHPDCIPPDDRLFLGEARQSIPQAAQKLGAMAALIHTDLGTGDHAANIGDGPMAGPGARRAGGAGLLRARQPAARGRALAAPARAAGRAEGPLLPLSRDLAAEQPDQRQQHDRAHHRADEARRPPDAVETERLAAVGRDHRADDADQRP